MSELRLSLEQARRLAIRAQYLAGPHGGIRQVLRALRCLQLDPVNVVARSHLLVLWSRLGGFDVAELDSLLWRERWLFEYWAHAASIVLTEDYPIHRVMMRAYPGGTSAEGRRKREWLAANTGLRDHILDTLRAAGPLPAEAFEDRAAVSWVSTGWTNGRNVERMLDILWKQGMITVAGRDGLRRLWRVADFRATPDEPEPELVARAAGLALLALGVARERDIVKHFTCGRYPGLDLPRYGFARRARVAGGTEQWWVHRDCVGWLDEPWVPRTTLLSPFDNLICDRDRAERLWGFQYRSELYVPKAKRKYGAYAMPVLHGDQLIGRVAPRLDRKRSVLVVDGVYAEPSAPRAAGPQVAAAVRALAAFCGAGSVSYAGQVCQEWASAIIVRQGESAGRPRQVLSLVRKVRAPQGRVVGNADPG